jgi:hypothetical protein
VPAPVTGDKTPLALAMHVRCGWDFSVKSAGSKVMWSDAPESTTQELLSPSQEELQGVVLHLPRSIVDTFP